MIFETTLTYSLYTHILLLLQNCYTHIHIYIYMYMFVSADTYAPDVLRL